MSGAVLAIQGELGSNSHAAALAVLDGLGRAGTVMPCTVSAVVFARVVDGSASGAVLPIENSLHGAVAEHYDLLLREPVRIVGETLLPIRHTLIASPGVKLAEVRRILSHPVALAQCRRFFEAHPEIEQVPFYDTAGSVKHVVNAGLREAAGIAPPLAAAQYGGEVLLQSLEDHASNVTRFHLVVREGEDRSPYVAEPNKMSVAFSVEHRPGALVVALNLLRDAGVDLTRIESRPVPGSPWQYVFFVELRFTGGAMADAAVAALRAHCGMVKELGRYAAVVL